MAHEHFPAGTVDDKGPIRNVPKGHHISWIARILPYVEENNLFNMLDLSLSAYHSKNDIARQTTIDVLVCPSNPDDYAPYSNYAGCHHDKEAPIDVNNSGVFFLNSRITRDDLKDGSAYTIFIGEKLIEDTDLGWLSGTPATLRNVGSPLNKTKGGGGWGAGGMPWVFAHATDTDDWVWGTDQIDPITGEQLQLNPETGEYEPIDQTSEQIDDGTAPPVDEPEAAETGGDTEAEPETSAESPAESEDAPSETEEPADAAAAMLAEGEVEPPQPKANAQGFYPHSLLGGNPANPLVVGGFSSRHADGVNFAFGDGSVRFIGEDVSASLMGRFANRADGKTISLSEW
jgi:prepilin-type processing-associated H-X9-DG protein